MSAPAVPASQTPFGITFAEAYYASKPPMMQPLYNQRPGGLTAPMLSQSAINSLVNQCIAAGLLIDEQIDFWGWDPYTVMSDRLMQGILWVPAGLGAVNSIQVITTGMYSGQQPEGTIKTSVTLSDYPSWSSTHPTPVVPVDPVGPLEYGPYYGVIGTNPPNTYTDSRGTFQLVTIPNTFLGMNSVSQFYILT